MVESNVAGAAAGQTLQETAYGYVKTSIEALTLKPGQSLYDAQIAASLGISRTPVREALRRLEREGLVVATPRRGWTVYRLQVEDIAQIFEIKEALEGMLTRKATANLDAATEIVLDQSLGQMVAAAAAGDHAGWIAADRRWHAALYGAACNDRARDYVATINSQWNRLRFWLMAIEGRMGSSLREHAAVHERVLARDPAGAEALMKEHLSNVGADIVDLLTNLVLPASAMVAVDEGR
jgi:GntR family transcriptional regulator, rspAB operon transcriptional repressor